MINNKCCKYFCCEDTSNIENYEIAVNDKTQMWHCHHRLETHNSDGNRRLIDLSKDELIALDMYCHRPASELIFFTGVEHVALHIKGRQPWNKGKKTGPLLEERRKKISDALKGNKNGLGKHHSEESRNKMSEAHKGKHWKLVDGKRVWY